MSLTSTKPWQILTMITSVGLSDVAPGTSRLRNEDMAIAVPNILCSKQGSVRRASITGSHILQKYRNHLKTLEASRVIWSRFHKHTQIHTHTQDAKYSRHRKNLVARCIFGQELMHSWLKLYLEFELCAKHW